MYFLVLTLVLIFAIKRRFSVLSIIVLSIYSLVGFFAILVFKNQLIDVEGIAVLPFIILLFIYFLFFFPLMQREKRLGTNKIIFKGSIFFYIFCIVYILCAIVTIILYMPSVLHLVLSGNWSSNRQDLYLGILNNVYSNRIEFYAINFVGYFRTVAVIVGFLFLSNLYSRQSKKKCLFIGYLTILVSILSSVITALHSSSRGSLVSLIILVVSVYLFTRKIIAKKRKRIMNISIVVFLLALIPFFIKITVSRFSDSEAIDSVVRYLGHAPLVFNKNIFNLPDIAFGNYSLGILFNSTFTEASVGGSWNTLFFTFVGWLWIDWGFVGTIVISVIVSLFMLAVTRKKNFDVSDIFLIISYFQFLTSGVFVIGRQYAYTLIGNILIFIVFKVISLFDKSTLANYSFKKSTI